MHEKDYRAMFNMRIAEGLEIAVCKWCNSPMDRIKFWSEAPVTFMIESHNGKPLCVVDEEFYLTDLYPVGNEVTYFCQYCLEDYYEAPEQDEKFEKWMYERITNYIYGG